MRLWYLLHRRPAKAQASQLVRAVSPEPLLFAHMKYGRRRRVRPKIRHLAPLDGCAYAFEESLRRTKSAIILCDGSFDVETYPVMNVSSEWFQVLGLYGKDIDCITTAFLIVLNAKKRNHRITLHGPRQANLCLRVYPSWQILTAHIQPFRGARDLAFCLKVFLDSLLVWASSGGSGETARMRRLAWTFAARIGDKYQIRLTRPTPYRRNCH